MPRTDGRTPKQESWKRLAGSTLCQHGYRYHLPYRSGEDHNVPPLLERRYVGLWRCAGCGWVCRILAFLFSDDVPRWSWTMTCLTVTATNMSLAVMKLANEVSLLEAFLDDYKKFNIHLTGEVDPWEPNDISALGNDTKPEETRG